MKFYATFMALILMGSVFAETEEIQQISDQLNRSNEQLLELINKLQSEDLSDKEKTDLQFISKSFPQNTEGIQYYLQAES